MCRTRARFSRHFFEIATTAELITERRNEIDGGDVPSFRIYDFGRGRYVICLPIFQGKRNDFRFRPVIDERFPPAVGKFSRSPRHERAGFGFGETNLYGTRGRFIINVGARKRRNWNYDVPVTERARSD